MYSKNFKKLGDFISEKSSFLLVAHQNPDGDAIGSLLALNEYLLGLGKATHMVIADKIPKVFRYLEGSDKIESDFLMGDFEAAIILDCGDSRRSGFPKRIFKVPKKNNAIINIDHHPKNDIWKMATINVANVESSSTCQIVYEFFIHQRVNISPTMSTALLTGIYGDTGGFIHPNTTKEVLEIVSELLRHGARLKKISKNISMSRTAPMLKLWGLAIGQMILYSDLKVAVSLLRRQDIERLGASEEDISGLVNFINQIPEAEVSMLIYETSDGKIRGSLRTDSAGVDVSRLASYFGGGGHKKAAGFQFEGKIIKSGNNWAIV